MANPILQALGQQQTAQQQAPAPVNNPMQMFQQFQQFRQEMAGKDPHQMVEELVQSGRMSAQQRDGLFQQAQSMLSLFRR